MKATTTYGLYNIQHFDGSTTAEFGWLIRWQFAGTDQELRRVARVKPTARQLRKDAKVVRGIMNMQLVTNEIAKRTAADLMARLPALKEPAPGLVDIRSTVT